MTGESLKNVADGEVPKPKVAFLISPDDRAILEKTGFKFIRRQLERLLGDENVFDPEKDIAPGADFKSIYEKNINSADVLIVVLSSDLCASDLGWDTMKGAEKNAAAGHQKVIYVNWRAVNLDIPEEAMVPGGYSITQLPTMGTTNNQDVAWTLVHEAINGAVASIHTMTPVRQDLAPTVMATYARPAGVGLGETPAAAVRRSLQDYFSKLFKNLSPEDFTVMTQILGLSEEKYLEFSKKYSFTDATPRKDKDIRYLIATFQASNVHKKKIRQFFYDLGGLFEVGYKDEVLKQCVVDYGIDVAKLGILRNFVQVSRHPKVRKPSSKP